MKKEFKIGSRMIGRDAPCFCVAEMSGNHLKDYGRAVEIIHAAKEAGADAVKLQTYTADSLSVNCDNEYFQIHGGLWDGMTEYKLYEEASTPWEWQPKLKEVAESLGMECFSSPFDAAAVDFMRDCDMPAYKIASFEITDIPLIRKVARRKKPVLISTGIAYLSDIELAVRTCAEEGNEQVVLLKCTSAYPSKPEEMNLKTIPSMAETFDCITGLSDHSFGFAAAVAGAALGAKVIEKHLTLKRSDGGPDAAFSMEAEEFREMCRQVRTAEQALGCVCYDLGKAQLAEREFARSLFVVQDIKKGEAFTRDNVRSVRPAYGLHTKYSSDILGKKARCDIRRGTPLAWEHLDATAVD